jgi:hypothetical protein
MNKSAAIHIPGEPEVVPPPSDGTDTGTWHTPGGYMKKGMPSSREPVKKFSVQGRKNYDKAFGEKKFKFNLDVIHNNFVLVEHDNGTTERLFVEKCQDCQFRSNRVDSGCSWHRFDINECKQAEIEPVTLEQPDYTPPLKGDGLYDQKEK